MNVPSACKCAAGRMVARQHCAGSGASKPSHRRRILVAACQLGLDLDLRGQRAVDGALAGDLEHAILLFVTQFAGDFHGAVDPVEQSGIRLALLAVGGVNLRMAESDRDRVERPALAPRVHGQRHRGARSQRSEEKVVGVRSCIGASRRHRLLACEPVSPDGYRLGKSGGVAVDDDSPCFRRLAVRLSVARWSVHARLVSSDDPADCGSGMPSTATTRTDGCEEMAASTSPEYTFPPPVTIMSCRRSRMWKAAAEIDEAIGQTRR